MCAGGVMSILLIIVWWRCVVLMSLRALLLQMKVAGSVYPVCRAKVPHFMRADERLPDLNLSEDLLEPEPGCLLPPPSYSFIHLGVGDLEHFTPAAGVYETSKKVANDVQVVC